MTPTLLTDVLIIGAGFAGVSTAYHLSRLSGRKILVIDKEELPGFHASGRNASLLLQAAEAPAIRKAMITSRKAFEGIAAEIAYHPYGSILLGRAETLEALRDPELESRTLDPRDVRKKVPVLEGHRFESAQFTPSDGVIDVSRLLQYYVEGARSRGAEFHFRCPVSRIEPGQSYQVLAGDMLIKSRIVVNAAGAWAADMGRLAGAADLPLRPFKRHLFVLDNPLSPDARLPFVWSLTENFYFRPESGGYLFSVCDEQASSSLEETVSEDIHDALAELIWDHLPGFREAVQRRVWSCFRTKTPDDHFFVGPDPVQEGFFWVAGLGGHGMGASWEVGRLAAGLLAEPDSGEPNPFHPGRERAELP